MRHCNDHTALCCLGIVALAATLNVGKFVPTPPTSSQPKLAGWADPFWDFTCNMTWHLPQWCPTPINDPKPKLTPPDPLQCGDPGFIGPCQP